jgi:flagellar motor switch protein FliM
MNIEDRRAQVLRFALEGERVRKAAKVLERESPRLAAALRRAVPFLARRGVAVTLSYTRATPVAELLESLPRPIHATPIFSVPGGVHGALLLDAGAIAMFLDGVLGGHGEDVPVLSPQGLSAPQTALMAGLTAGIARAFSDALVGSLGVRFECRAVSADDGLSESTPIACVLEFGSEAQVGRVALLLPKEILLPLADDSAALPIGGADPRVVGVLEGVEIELIAELGRMQLRVGDLGALRVGDTLRLDVPVSGTVSVRANQHVLLRGRPTTSGGRIAIEIAAPSRDQ